MAVVKLAEIILVPKDGGTVIRPEIWAEAEKLVGAITQIQVRGGFLPDPNSDLYALHGASMVWLNPYEDSDLIPITFPSLHVLHLRKKL